MEPLVTEYRVFLRERPEADAGLTPRHTEVSGVINGGRAGRVGSAQIQEDAIGAAAEYADPFPARTEPVTDDRDIPGQTKGGGRSTGVGVGGRGAVAVHEPRAGTRYQRATEHADLVDVPATIPVISNRLVTRQTELRGALQGIREAMLVPRIQIPGADARLTEYRATHDTDLADAVAGPVAHDGLVIGETVVGETEVPDGIATGNSIPRAVVVGIDIPLANTHCREYRTTEYADRDDSRAEPVSGHGLVTVETEVPEVIGRVVVVVVFVPVKGKLAEPARLITEYGELLEVRWIAGTTRQNVGDRENHWLANAGTTHGDICRESRGPVRLADSIYTNIHARESVRGHSSKIETCLESGRGIAYIPRELEAQPIRRGYHRNVVYLATRCRHPKGLTVGLVYACRASECQAADRKSVV